MAATAGRVGLEAGDKRAKRRVESHIIFNPITPPPQRVVFQI